MSRFTQRGCELLKDVEDTVEATTQRELRIRGLLERKDLAGLPKDLGRVIADRLAEEWGGQNVYIPMDSARRNARLYNEFTGDNVHDLAKKYRLSVARVYSIVADERTKRRMPQLRLPMSS
ncbi:Mor transcription activator domain-containing protein [Nitratidesulfovibrio sp. HK-II]|uniref:Mor transcription activator family protein n=1 Tax=Nitratidesulfovibrio sp. HK-II TaxID=2009266 RepID=UPI003A5E5687